MNGFVYKSNIWYKCKSVTSSVLYTVTKNVIYYTDTETGRDNDKNIDINVQNVEKNASITYRRFLGYVSFIVAPVQIKWSTMENVEKLVNLTYLTTA